MFYKIKNRNSLGDYKGINADDILGIAYSPDMETAIVKLSVIPLESTDIVQSSEKEYEEMQKEYQDYIANKETTVLGLSEIEKLKRELEITQRALLDTMLKGDLNE